MNKTIFFGRFRNAATHCTPLKTSQQPRSTNHPNRHVTIAVHYAAATINQLSADLLSQICRWFLVFEEFYL